MTLTIMQSVSSGNTAAAVATITATFGSAPTHGNLLIAVVGMSTEGGVTPAGANGWTCQSFTTGSGSSAHYQALFYKYAGASEPATQVLESASIKRHQWPICMWEISGVSGTWTSDFQAFHSVPLGPFGSGLGSGTPLTTTSFNTANNNELLLLGVSGNGVTSAATLSSSAGTSDSSKAQGPTVDGLGAYDASRAYHLAEATSGTAISSTLSMSTSDAYTNIGYGFVELNTPAAPSTETGNVAMVLKGVAFSGTLTPSPEPGSTHLALRGVGFNVVETRVESVTVSLALGNAKFAVAEKAEVIGNAALTLGRVAIHAYASDLDAVTKLRQFQTFG